MRKAVFIDKDGTLVKNVPYNANAALVELEEGACHFLEELHRNGYALFIVTNQSGIALGHFTEEAFLSMIAVLLQKLPAPIEEVLYCPHHPEGKLPQYSKPCKCRKPAPGLLLTAAQKARINLEASWMIGDILHDIEAGKRAGCHTVLLNNGGETEWELSPWRIPHYVTGRLEEALDIILSHDLKQNNHDRIHKERLP